MELYLHHAAQIPNLTRAVLFCISTSCPWWPLFLQCFASLPLEFVFHHPKCSSTASSDEFFDPLVPSPFMSATHSVLVHTVIVTIRWVFLFLPFQERRVYRLATLNYEAQRCWTSSWWITLKSGSMASREVDFPSWWWPKQREEGREKRNLFMTERSQDQSSRLGWTALKSNQKKERHKNQVRRDAR